MISSRSLRNTISTDYNLLDLHYNYKVFEFLEASVSAMNIANDVHRELIGGAKMGRQIVFRLTSSF